MRVLFVEDDEEISVVICEELEAAGFNVCHVTTLEAGYDALTETDCDVGLVDIGLPDGCGIDLITRMARRASPIPSLAFTIFDDEATVLEAIDAGARGYVLKDDDVHELARALSACVHGEAPISGRAARHLLPRSPEGLEEPSPLTRRETDVVILLAKGFGYRECADLLGIGLGTVQSHVKSIYRKLEIGSKAEAAAWAARRGLL